MSNFQRTGQNILRNRVGVLIDGQGCLRKQRRIAAKHNIGDASDKLKYVNPQWPSVNGEDGVSCSIRD
jgi:hypothetical protein